MTVKDRQKTNISFKNICYGFSFSLLPFHAIIFRQTAWKRNEKDDICMACPDVPGEFLVHKHFNDSRAF